LWFLSYESLNYCIHMFLLNRESIK